MSSSDTIVGVVNEALASERTFESSVADTSTLCILVLIDLLLDSFTCLQILVMSLSKPMSIRRSASSSIRN
jgi:hypothetical protein